MSQWLQLIKHENKDSKLMIISSNFLNQHNGDIWLAMTAVEADLPLEDGHIYIQNITKQQTPVCITTINGSYDEISGIFDSKDRMWLVYTNYKSGQKSVLLTCLKDGRILETFEISGGYGKYRCPAIACQSNQLLIAWEAYQNNKIQIQCCTLLIESDDIKKTTSANKYITDADEIAYKPKFITDENECLYFCYESYFNNRYHLMCRVKGKDKDEFSTPVEFGLNEFNDMELSLHSYQGKILAAWENTQPLEKGYIWTNPRGDNTIIPTFGHGWRVKTQIALRCMSYKNGTWLFEHLKQEDDQKDGNDAVIEIDPTESAGCPKVFSDKNGRIYIAYLTINQKKWELAVKYFDGKQWCKLTDTGMILRERFTPTALYSALENKIYLQGFNNMRNHGIYVNSCDLKFSDTVPLYTFILSETVKSQSSVAMRKIAPFQVEYQGKNLNVWWGDLHMHSNLSYCSLQGRFHCTEIQDKYRYSKDVGQLDFAMTADHDKTMTAYELEKTRQAAAFYNMPGAFISFMGYEWTSSQQKDRENFGHHNVLYLDDGPLHRCNEDATDTPLKLWSKLDSNTVLTIPHHSSDDVHPVNWDKYNSKFAPLAEIFQVRGSYEYDDCPMNPLNYGRGVVKGHSLREALNRGYEIGFTSGGEHEGVGVTAVYAEELSRGAIFKALKQRHTYGTTGARIELDFRVNGHLMGESIEIYKEPTVTIKVKGTAPIQKLHIVRDGVIAYEWHNVGEEAIVEWTDDNLNDEYKHYYYVVVMQENDEMAWASPVFVKMKKILVRNK